MNELDKLDTSSSEEAEQAQAIALIREAQALDYVRQQLARQQAQPSATECVKAVVMIYLWLDNRLCRAHKCV